MSTNNTNDLILPGPPPPIPLVPHLIHIIEIFSDDDSDSDMEIEMSDSRVSENVLNVYVDIAIATERFVKNKIDKKEKISSVFINNLNTQIDAATILYHSIPMSHDLKYDFGAVLQDLKNQRFKIQQYMYSSKRKTAAQEAKIEAYQDPEVACYAELSKDGLKTRNRFYKR